MEKHEGIDKELKEHLNKRILKQEDLDRHTLKHKSDKDLRRINIDEGY